MSTTKFLALSPEFLDLTVHAEAFHNGVEAPGDDGDPDRIHENYPTTEATHGFTGT